MGLCQQLVQLGAVCHRRYPGTFPTQAERLLDRAGCLGRRHRPAHENDRQAERARRRDLAVGGVAAAVLGHDHVDAVLLQQLALVLGGEGAASRHDLGVEERQRLERRVHQPHQEPHAVHVGEGLQLLAADGEEGASASTGQPRAASAPSTTAQRSPACRGQGGRSSRTNGTPVERLATTAWRLICSA